MFPVQRTDSAQPVVQPPPTGLQPRPAPWRKVLRQVLPTPPRAHARLPARGVWRAFVLLVAAPPVAVLAWAAAGTPQPSPAAMGVLAAGWLAGAAGLAWRLWRSQQGEAGALPQAWLAGAAHALRNRLAALGGATEVLATPAAETAVRERARAIAGQQLRQLAHLADNLAALAPHAQGAAATVQGAPQDLSALALAALDAQRPLAAAAGQLLLHATGPTPVQGEARALEQAVAGLLRHALRQLPVGAGLVLQVRAEPPEAVLTLRSDPRSRAAPPERAAPPPDDGDLGLALAHCTVARHGGRLSVAGGSDPAVELRLPLRAAGPRNGAVTARPAALRVMLVEDVAGVRDSVAAQLRGDGHAVSAHADGEAGLRSLLDEWPDAAVVDLSLPGLSGCALARGARRAGYGGRMVAIAGYEPSLERAEALRAGFDACLHKPVRASQLRQALAGRENRCGDSWLQPGHTKFR